jgi:DNA-binding transcriptional regulator YhcF (GntR family)
MNGAIYGRTVSSAQKQCRRRLVMSFEMVRLDRGSSEPLYQQLYRQIREELESGSFDSSASRVPSSRVLAATLGISRPTVNQAFSKLLAEGYLQARKRSGIFVADHLPATFLKAARSSTTARTEHSLRVARRVTRMADCRPLLESRCGTSTILSWRISMWPVCVLRLPLPRNRRILRSSVQRSKETR